MKSDETRQAGPERSVRLGMLTPSSNSVLEPMTASLLKDLAGVTAHFARLRVTEISIGQSALAQFDVAPMLTAAELLVDVQPQALVWNGTSGGWRGLDADRAVKTALEDRFGLPASTVTLALVDLLRARNYRRIAFVTPYTEDVQARIVATFSKEGFECVAAPCLGISENFAFGQVAEATMDDLAETAAAARPQVIIPYCTNLAATRAAVRWEARHGVPVLDSIAVAARAGLELTGLSPASITGWGSVFDA